MNTDIEFTCDNAPIDSLYGPTPEAVIEAAEQARDRGQTAGTIYSGGLRWHWRERWSDVTLIEITEKGRAILRAEVETLDWIAFKTAAFRAGFSPRDYLVLVVQAAVNDLEWPQGSDSLLESVKWIFPSAQ